MYARQEHLEENPGCRIFRTIYSIRGSPHCLSIGLDVYDDDMKKAWQQYVYQIDYNERLITYPDVWETSKVTREMASFWGFIYTGIGNSIECTYCHCIFDDPIDNDLTTIHKERTPNCIFINNV
jgi:hypothetical protein